MFDREYVFRGKHAEKVSKLTSKFDKNHQLFNRNIDVYMIAPVIGFLYGRKAEIDKGPETAKIFGDQIRAEELNLKFVYQLIMLLDEKNEPNFEERVNKAFRYFGTDKSKDDEVLFEQYVRGGVEVLYEKLIEKSNSTDDYLISLFDLIEDIQDRYNQNISLDNIMDLCKLARD